MESFLRRWLFANIFQTTCRTVLSIIHVNKSDKEEKISQTLKT